MNDQYLTMSVILGVVLGMSVGMFMIAIACAIWSFLSYSKVVGFENSTHRIEYHNPLLDTESDKYEVEGSNPFHKSQEEGKEAEAERKAQEKRNKEQEKFMNIAFGGNPED